MTPTTDETTTHHKNRQVGLWLVGGRGAISTCVAYGLSGLKRGLLEPVGLVSAREPLSALDLIPTESLVLGGHDVCKRGLSVAAAELVKSGVLGPELVEAAVADVVAFEANLRPGPLDGPDVGMADLDPRSAELGAAPPREQIATLVADLTEFRERERLDHVVVANLASTEAGRTPQAEWQDASALEEALDREQAQPASLIYAYAAFSAGCSFVNFTPSQGASSPALLALAEAQGVPHCGRDGKTGETLVKTVLAPLFRDRALKVLSWQGYNMLGNRDGEVLRSEAHKQAKLDNKDEALRSILGEADMHSHVGIDFVPSLADWKTAWDFIHFEGFLGVRMSLQFTWAGSDSALAAPLVIDLARLTDFAARRGESGVMTHSACFFKAPLMPATAENGGSEHDFHRQMDLLYQYVARHT
jgi:myo-inositol-1-phosphate synthase